MSRAHADFLGTIADKSWQQQPGSSILIELGPVARAAVAAAFEKLQGQPADATADLTGLELSDFSVRQVTVDGMDQLSGGVGARLEKEARKSCNPVAVPDNQLRHVLLLTDEYDELRATRLAVTAAGTLEVSVGEEQFHDGRTFAVSGGIPLALLAAY